MTLKQKPILYRSFLVRLWQDEEAEMSASWQGEIESIQSGQKWHFADLETMFNFLQSQLDDKQSESLS